MPSAMLAVLCISGSSARSLAGAAGAVGVGGGKDLEEGSAFIVDVELRGAKSGHHALPPKAENRPRRSPGFAVRRRPWTEAMPSSVVGDADGCLWASGDEGSGGHHFADLSGSPCTAAAAAGVSMALFDAEPSGASLEEGRGARHTLHPACTTSDAVMKDGILKMDIHSSISVNEELDIAQTNSFGACECSHQLIYCI